MCYHSQTTVDAQTLEKRFKAQFSAPGLYKPGIYNGFSHPFTPVVTNEDLNTIQLFQWGLLPFWAKDKKLQVNTLNAKIETLTEKPSFRNVVNQRCLVLANGFYEWQWLDSKGKEKQKYFIQMEDEQPYAYAGLYSIWSDISTGETIPTYTIITTEANELMSKIHNNKKRMPVILTPDEEDVWMVDGLASFKDIGLKAKKV